ncbi:MAG: RyR domain-containing protein, partial [Thermodesulfobacteriota bacterium]
TDIARVCHEANRTLQAALNEPLSARSSSWENSSEDIKLSVEHGVLRALKGATPEELHEECFVYKTRHGWVHGEFKSDKYKTHPNLVSYDRLPESQKLKDKLFLAIVETLKGEE